MLRPILTPVLRPALWVKPASVALAILLGAGSFSPGSLFGLTDPGIHLETYDPNSILRRVNQLVGSEDYSNAAWTKTDYTPTLTGQTAPDGAPEALLTEGATLGGFIRQTVTADATLPFTTSAVLKRGNNDWVRVMVSDNAGASGSRAWFNLALGTIGATQNFGTGSGVTASIASLGGGYYRCTVSGIVGAGTSVAHFTLSATADANTTRVAGATFLRGGTQLERAATATAYQKVSDWYTEFMAAGGERVTMFQDSACTTPVVKAEDPIGAIISTERGAARGANVASANYATIATFDNGTAVVSATAFTQTAGTTSGRTVLPLALTVGDWYEVTCTLDSISSGTAQVLAKNNASGTGGTIAGTPALAAGQARFAFQAAAANSLTWQTTNAAATVNASAINIRRLPGKVITQGTSGFRPVLRPLVNMLTKTDQFDDAFWVKADTTVTANAAVAPDGAATADLMTEGAAGSSGVVSGLCTTATSSRARIAMKRGNTDWIRLRLLANGGVSGGNFWVNLGTGAKGSTGAIGAGSGLTHTVNPLGNGWYEILLNATTGDTLNFIQFMSASDDGSTSRVNNATYYAWGADLRTAADAALNIPRYQRVNTVTDYDTDGFPQRVKHDGSDDFFSVPLNMSAANKVDVFVDGLLKTNDAAAQVLVETTATSATTAGSLAITAPGTTATPNYLGRSFGTVRADATTLSNYPAPANGVIHLVADIANDVCKLNLNDVEVASSIGDQGAGSYANDTLYIGARAGTTLRSSMGWCAITIRGSATANLSASQKARRCRWGQRIAKII